MGAQITKAWQVFINGKPFPHSAKKIAFPKLTRNMENFRSSTMAGETKTDLGLKALEAEITFQGYISDALANFGTCNSGEVIIRVLCSIEDNNCGFTQVERVMKGRWEEIDEGSLEAGKSDETKIKATLDEYISHENGVEKIYIDLPHTIERYNGVDRLEKRRAALQLSV